MPGKKYLLCLSLLESGCCAVWLLARHKHLQGGDEPICLGSNSWHPGYQSVPSICFLLLMSLLLVFLSFQSFLSLHLQYLPFNPSKTRFPKGTRKGKCSFKNTVFLEPTVFSDSEIGWNIHHIYLKLHYPGWEFLLLIIY